MKQECGETLGDLEPVYYLFTTMGEITLPQAVTHVSYHTKRNETDTKVPRTDERDILGTTLNSTNKKRTWVEEGRRWKTRLILKHPEQMKEAH